jgi:hypothetical protein
MWSGDARKQAHLRRRFMLLGQTLDGMRVWDIRQAIGLARERWKDIPIELQAAGTMAVNALYASLFEPGIARLTLASPPSSQMEGPDYLNVLRVLDVSQALAMALDRCPVRLETPAPHDWEHASRAAPSKQRLEIVKVSGR